MFRKARDPNDTRKDGLVRSGIRALSSGVGLVSESIKARGDSKSPQTNENTKEDNSGLQPNAPPPAYSAAVPESNLSNYLEEAATKDNLEQEWALNDAQDQLVGEHSITSPPEYDQVNLEQNFLCSHPLSENIVLQGLSLPVVLPQRRPRDRSRGFIRAYAPILENAGIDEPTWMDFLDTFQKSSAASPWLNAINLAGIATNFIPHGLGFLAGIAIQETANLAIEFQARERTNNFLTQINKSFFQPRGLYCLIMTWNPHSTRRLERVNIAGTVESRTKISEETAGISTKFRSSDGKGWGEIDFPQVAPLVFPVLDAYGARTDAAAPVEKTKFTKTFGFVANYWDKRATAQYSLEAPNSILAQVPQQEFKSRYADPKSHAASGSMIAFLSGGHLVPNPESRGLIGGLVNVTTQAVRGEKQGSGWERERERERYDAHLTEYGTKEGFVSERKQGMIRKAIVGNRYSKDYQGGGRVIKATRGGLGLPAITTAAISTPVIEGYKKLLGKNVLYLLVVNMPNEEEIAAARAAFG